MFSLVYLCSLFGRSRQSYYEYNERADKADMAEAIVFKLVKEIREDISFSRIMTRMDPTLDLMTEQMIADGEEALGEYDFVIEWRIAPPPGSLRELVRKLDEILESTGCRYTITTK